MTSSVFDREIFEIEDSRDKKNLVGKDEKAPDRF